jgi:cellulose biosynthesis protein BcsQ
VLRRGCVVDWIKQFSAWLADFLDPYDGLLKLASYIIGPAFAIVASVRNGRDRADLIRQARELGKLEKAVTQARAALEERERELRLAQGDVQERQREVEKLRHDLHSVTEDSQQLWKLRPAKPFAEYLTWLRDPAGAKTITFGNLKGGVGKTTLAANFAAYLSTTRNMPVLLVDLDYQGSLSNMLMLAIEREEVESRVDWLLDETASLATVDRASIHLVPKLSQAWLIPANYTFAQIENQLLLRWLLQEDGGIDVRFRLAHALLAPDVRRRYGAIIFDMPPRMTLGSINALVASHYFVVPTVLDSLSAEAVRQFLVNMRAIKKDLQLDIDLAGIAGVMTRQKVLSSNEARALEAARDGGAAWKEDADFVFSTTLPRRVDIANAAGEDIAYFGNDANGPLKDLFDPLFQEIYNAVWK